jgi:3-oxoacyl-[acyl-carrier protein] reductase
MKQANNLKGKVALVTGGSRGIGKAIAEALAAEGASVAISYVNSADKANNLVAELKKQDIQAIAIKADQADPKQVAQLVKEVHKHFGRLDILVNNAGLFVPSPVGQEENLAELDRQLAVNVGGVIAAIRTAAPLLSDGGRIISIGSVVGTRTAFPGLADYGLTKAAVAGYSRGAARDLAPRKITVNVVQPGPIDTDMNPDSGDFAASLKANLALPRYGKAEEIAAGVVFLASPAASFITGTTLDIDGGYNA